MKQSYTWIYTLSVTDSDGSSLVGAHYERGALLLVHRVLGVTGGLVETATDVRVRGHVVGQLNCPQSSPVWGEE